MAARMPYGAIGVATEGIACLRYNPSAIPKMQDKSEVKKAQ
jgi:hypothetical protein